jgi:hypothetical protein
MTVLLFDFSYYIYLFIIECLVQLYFSHDPSLLKEFMESKGHESLYCQERSHRSRDT